LQLLQGALEPFERPHIAFAGGGRRSAARLGEVRSPMNSAIFSELAASEPPASNETSRPASLIRAPRCWRWTSTSRCMVTHRSQSKKGIPAAAW
jgi:hypothetical protein